MSGRKVSSSIGSLELFLDTICNTFGGILFILIFVIVLLRMTQKTVQDAAQDGVSPVEYAAMETRLAELEHDWKHLSEQVVDLAELNSRLVRPDKARIHAKWKELLKENQTVVEQISAMSQLRLQYEKEISELHSRATTAAAELEKLTSTTSELRHKVEQKQKTLKKLRDSRVEDSSLPEMTDHDGHVVGLVLRFRRLYLWHRYSPQGQQLGLNTDDFTIVNETSESIISLPKPWRGIALDDNPQKSAQIRKLVANFSPSRHYMALIVFHDTFEEYRDVARVLKERGFSIQPHVMEPGKGVSDRGGTDSRAQ